MLASEVFSVCSLRFAVYGLKIEVGVWGLRFDVFGLQLYLIDVEASVEHEHEGAPKCRALVQFGGWRSGLGFGVLSFEF